MMVPEVASTSVVLVVFVLIVLLLFIWKLKVNIVREVHPNIPNKYRMLPTSQRRIPFAIEINDPNNKKELEDEDTNSVVRSSAAGSHDDSGMVYFFFESSIIDH